MVVWTIPTDFQKSLVADPVSNVCYNGHRQIDFSTLFNESGVIRSTNSNYWTTTCVLKKNIWPNKCSLLAPRKVDYLQSAFSLKIRLVVISSSSIANHDIAKPKHAARVLRFRVR